MCVDVHGVDMHRIDHGLKDKTSKKNIYIYMYTYIYGYVYVVSAYRFCLVRMSTTDGFYFVYHMVPNGPDWAHGRHLKHNEPLEDLVDGIN